MRAEMVQEMSQTQTIPTRLSRCGTRVVAEVRWLVRVLISSCDRFYWDNGFSKAASLAYSSLLSLVPLIALGFGILTSFAVSSQYVPGVRQFLFRQFVPSEATQQYVDTAIQYMADFSAALSDLNALVICFVVITALLLVNSVEYALNETWQVFEPRPIAHRIAIFSAIILIAPLLLFSAYYFTEMRLEPLLLEYGHENVWYLSYKHALPFLFDLVAFVCLYYMVPKAPVRLRSAIFGAVIATLMFALAKWGFAVYLAEFASYDKVYRAVSAISAIPVFLFWLYLVWSIVLFGAEASYQAQYLPKSGKLWKRSVLSVGDARLVLGVQSLILIARAFEKGEKLPNDFELAEFLGCSTVVLKPALDMLEKAGLVSRGDSRDMPLTLMRSPSKIQMLEVKEALFGQRSALHFLAEMEKLFGKLKNEGGLHVTTLSDIM